MATRQQDHPGTPADETEDLEVPADVEASIARGDAMQAVDDGTQPEYGEPTRGAKNTISNVR